MNWIIPIGLGILVAAVIAGRKKKAEIPPNAVRSPPPETPEIKAVVGTNWTKLEKKQ